MNYTRPDYQTRLAANAEEMYKVLEACYDHLEELSDAWSRGILSEGDGKGGTRSNRNADLLTAVNNVLALVRRDDDLVVFPGASERTSHE